MVLKSSFKSVKHFPNKDAILVVSKRNNPYMVKDGLSIMQAVQEVKRIKLLDLKRTPPPTINKGKQVRLDF